MKEIDIGKTTKVKLDDHRTLMAEGMGNIEIEEMKGNMVYNKCYNVYGMQCNLLSFGKHMQNSYTMIMKNNSLELFDRNQMLMWKSPFLQRIEPFKLA